MCRFSRAPTDILKILAEDRRAVLARKRRAGRKVRPEDRAEYRRLDREYESVDGWRAATILKLESLERRLAALRGRMRRLERLKTQADAEERA